LPLEVVVIDNASTDGAAQMVRDEFPWVRLVCNRVNRGFAAANNQAAARARGRWLLFLNNDAEAPPGALRRLLAYARAHPEAGLVGPRLRDGRGRTQLSARARPTVQALLHRTLLFRWTGLFRAAYRRYRGRGHDPDQTRAAEVLMGAALLIRRRLFRAVGGWDEGFTFGGEDIDLCRRVGRTHAVVYHPDVSLTHHGRASSRLQAGYAYSHTVAGIVHALRLGGCPEGALWFYKAVFTLEAPLVWLGHAAQWLWRRLRGRRTQAERSRLRLAGLWHFLTRGLAAFWRA
jgi:GT2 family glycosyltransferase